LQLVGSGRAPEGSRRRNVAIRLAPRPSPADELANPPISAPRRRRPPPGTVQDEFGLDQPPNQKDPCAGVNGTADHTLRFDGGHFALFAGDELGWEASYEFVDDDTFITGAPDVMTFDFQIESNKLYIHVAGPAKQAAGTPAPYVATWESAAWERED